MYRLQLTTSYAENWRYNIMITLAMLDSEGNQIGYHSIEDSLLPVGANSDSAPEGWHRRREVALDFEACSRVRFYIYLLPNSLPTTTTLAGESTSFPMQLTVGRGDENLFTERLEINRFGGYGKEFVVDL